AARVGSSRNLPGQIDVQHDIRRRADGEVLVHGELDDGARAELPPSPDRQLDAGIAELLEPRVVERAVHLDLRLYAGARPRPQAAADHAEHAAAAGIIADALRLSDPQAADAPEVARRTAAELRLDAAQQRDRNIGRAAAGEDGLVARRQLQRRLKVRAAVRAERAPDPDEHVAEPARASLQRVERHAALAEHVHELAFRPSVASAVREPE